MKFLQKAHLAWPALSLIFPLAVMTLVITLRPPSPAMRPHPPTPHSIPAGSHPKRPEHPPLLSPRFQLRIVTDLANTFANYL